MASEDRSSKKGKDKEAKGSKNSLVRLLSSCGSGRSKQAKNKSANLKESAPLDLSEGTWARIHDDNNDANVSHELVTVNAIPGHGTDEEVEISYTDLKEIGKGTFGIVYRARFCDTGELVAIKKTLDDPKFKNRELEMMRQLEHPNILNLRYFFYTEGVGYKKGERYLHMILDFIPETLFSVAKCDGTYSRPLLEPLYVKVYTYQVFRSLAYLHSLHISHRDVKPQNLLLNPETHVIKLCDFGSAKELSKEDTNVAYICSRYYRAPELVLGATDYTCQIDVWSAGCVLAELFQGHPIFPGANGPDQMVEIIKILGTPTMDDLASINPRFTQFRFPYLAPHPWDKTIKNPAPPEAIDLMSRLLVYSPSRRITPLEACAHPFYDELRRKGTRFKNGRRLPPLFNFKPEELEISPALNSRLRPDFDEDDQDYVDSLERMPLPIMENHSVGNLPARLDSFRSSFKKTVPKIQAQLKRIGSKRGEKPELKASIEATDLEDRSNQVEHEDYGSEIDEKLKHDESTEEFDGTLEGDTSTTMPEGQPEVRKKKSKGKGKGKHSKHVDDSDVADDSKQFMDSFASSVNPSSFDHAESLTADVESLEIQAPKKKKKGTRKHRKEQVAEDDGDTTLEEGPAAPVASTPTGEAECPLDTPPLPVRGVMEVHKDPVGDMTKKTKKIKKKKTKNVNGGTVETTEVTETVVMTTTTSREQSSKMSDI